MEGRVVDAKTEVALEGVEVVRTVWRRKALSSKGAFSFQPLDTSTRTDRHGRFLFPGWKDNGQLQGFGLSAFKLGYVPVRIREWELPDGQAVPREVENAFSPVALRLRGHVIHADMRLRPVRTPKEWAAYLVGLSALHPSRGSCPGVNPLVIREGARCLREGGHVTERLVWILARSLGLPVRTCFLQNPKWSRNPEAVAVARGILQYCQDGEGFEGFCTLRARDVADLEEAVGTRSGSGD